MAVSCLPPPSGLQHLSQVNWTSRIRQRGHHQKVQIGQECPYVTFQTRSNTDIECVDTASACLWVDRCLVQRFGDIAIYVEGPYG